MKINDSNSSETNSIQHKKSLYSKINFWSCLVAIMMSVGGFILNIVTQLITVNIWVHLAIAISIGVIGLLSLIPLIWSWVKLRKIEKQSKSDDTNSLNNK